MDKPAAMSTENLQREYQPRLELMVIAMNRLKPASKPWSAKFNRGGEVELHPVDETFSGPYIIPQSIFYGKLNAVEVIKWLKQYL